MLFVSAIRVSTLRGHPQWYTHPYIRLLCFQVIKMLVIVVALFAICWLPLQTYNILAYIYPEINEYVQ
jgi:leucokinin receptor